ncbi:MAG: guanine deaminase [Crocinitomicaceae bacterium]|jgi:guanine deaminase
MAIKAYRSSILHFKAEAEAEYFDDGILVVDGDTVKQVGNAADLLKDLNGLDIQTFKNKIIMPGFIDTHIHYPQVDVIASYGKQLLDWLNNYTFPTEIQFEDPDFAKETANFFLDELVKNGTTTALVFGTKHKQSVDAFFEASSARNTRMICGKVMMNRNAPDELCDDVQSSFDDSQALIDQWHGNGRQLYAVTPRFAITSTGEQLGKAGELLKNNPSVYMQTHLSENKDEIAFTMKLFPERKSYLDIYDHYGLLGPRSVFAHGIHLEDEDFKRLADTQSSISFCPMSNLFLGSGLFKLETANKFNTQVSVATDVGGGTSFSMLQTLSEAYKVCQLNGYSLDAKQAFYMATLGNAKTLMLDDKIGNFESGKEADFIVVDLESTALMARKQSKCKSLDEALFSLMILGDDRSIAETYVAGEQIYKK